jgi:hypothetical protein
MLVIIAALLCFTIGIGCGLYYTSKDNTQLIYQIGKAYNEMAGWVRRAEVAEGKLLETERRPKLDDWTNGEPGWDYDAVLRGHGVQVTQDESGWSLSWEHGCMHIGKTEWRIAREAAAVFVSLWLLGVSASMADKLMDGYIAHLERQQ